MTIQPFTIVTFTAVLFYVALLWIVLTRQGRSRLYKYFSLYLISMIFWSFGAFMVYANSPVLDTITWNRIMIVGTMGMPIAFFGFIQVYLMRDWKRWLWLGTAAYAIALIADTQDWVITDSKLINGQLIFTTGWASWIPIVSWVIFIGSSTLTLIREYSSARDLAYKSQLKHLLVVIAVITAGAVTDAIPLTEGYPIDILFDAVAALLIANAIVRHKFLDTNFVLRKTLFYSLPTIFIGLVFFLVIYTIDRFMPERSDLEFFLISGVIAVLAALLAQPIRDWIQHLIDRLFFRDKYNSTQMLQRISQTAAAVLDQDQLTLMILNEVCNTLHVKKAAFFLLDVESGAYFIKADFGMDLAENTSLSRNNPVVTYLSKHHDVLSRYDINVKPQFRGMWTQERNDLEKINAELFIPLNAKSELVGIFVVGEKQSGEGFSQDDHLTLVTLANQTAVAIENARLYSAEQSRRRELNALFQLTRQLVATDNVDTVLDSTRQIVEDLNVSFAWILTPKPDGAFTYRAAYPTNVLEAKYGISRPIPRLAERYFQDVLVSGEPALLSRSTNGVTEETKKALLMESVTTLCISPLKVGDEAIGLLVVGNTLDRSQPGIDPNKVRLISNMADQVANALLRADLHEQMEESFVQTVIALATAAESHDSYTQGHMGNTVVLSEETGREMGLTDDMIKALHWAAQLHDIGKIGIPMEIINKTGPLSPAEWEVMKRHTIIGARIVAPIKKLDNVAPIIRAHHERFDGAGYPYGLAAETIPLESRILSVVDSYCAMIDERSYRKARTHAEAVMELKRCSGTQFDPKIVEAFLRVLDRGVHLKIAPIVFQKDISLEKTRPLKQPFEDLEE